MGKDRQYKKRYTSGTGGFPHREGSAFGAWQAEAVGGNGGLGGEGAGGEGLSSGPASDVYLPRVTPTRVGTLYPPLFVIWSSAQGTGQERYKLLSTA